MNARFEFDHLSIGVRQPLAVARVLRSELGAEPLIGGVLPQFRYLLMHLGDVRGESVLGGRLELISTPHGPERPDDGFMHRFLGRHGEAAHHLSFNVPSVRPVRESLHAAGFVTVQEDLDFPAWQELFLPPDAVHGVLIQVASTPKPIRTQDLFGTSERDWAALPNNRDAVDPGWWDQLWEVPVPGAGDRAMLGPVVLGTSDPELSDLLFRRILRGVPGGVDAALPKGARSYTWPTGSLVVVEGEPGVRGAVHTPPTNIPGTGGFASGHDRHIGAVRLCADLEELL